jgi:hypothetical protein
MDCQRRSQKNILTFTFIWYIIHLKEIRKLFGICKKVLDLVLILAYNSDSLMEIPIQATENFMLLETAVFIFCMIGCGLTSHALGKQQGIEQTIEHLVDHGMLELEEE